MPYRGAVRAGRARGPARQVRVLLKYAESIYDLRDSGFSLYLMDHRGMGISGPLPEDDPGKAHVESFDDYVQDLRTFVDQVVDAGPIHAAGPPRPFAGRHSGADLPGAPSGEVRGAILCAPMLRIDTDPLPAPVARAMGGAAVRSGRGSLLPRSWTWEPGTFEGNVFTRSHVRWSRGKRRSSRRAPSPDSADRRSAGCGRAWRRAARAAERGGESRSRVILFQAGMDEVVRPGAQDEALPVRVGLRARLFPAARHEILMESDAIRDEAVPRILDFLARIAVEAP